jgi:uncharacterized membrane protein YedE/YeeE
MKGALAAFASGALFSAGLLVSGMTQPAKVQGFLDFFGAWDASLMFVMIGAIGVHAVLRLLIARRAAPVFAPAFEARAKAPIDGRLLLGSAVFGIGWGLGGYCPGPAFVSAGSIAPQAILFVAAMSAGMVLHRVIHARPELQAAAVQADCDASLRA